MLGIPGLQTDVSGSGKISSSYFAIGAKNENLARWTRIGVLVFKFSWIGGIGKHAPLVFTRNGASSKTNFKLIPKMLIRENQVCVT